ncbi:MAG: 3-hydroxyacyl-CoA dehydrogenase [Gammaproteobacteria bacterium RIFCSPLOWO2_02_FULL_61_13]|nr:MAG: 3-hydroxyacyl-CoA dehydrogenase [Gammaproteobacteria bacterium RIFCSPLOWO2_02_FULL_61_13]
MKGFSLNNPLLTTPTRPLPKWLGVVGAGTIGPDIAYYLKSEIPDLHLVLVDVRQDALDQAVDRLHAYADKGVARGKLTPEQADNVRNNIVPSLDYEALAYCDWIIEAATENLELKKRIFSQAEAVIRPDAIITSNTSSIPAARLFSHLKHPERSTVTHFFAPAYRNHAVEVIRWEKSDPGMVEYLRWLFCTTGKVPLMTKDVVCFMLDRIFDNWCNESGLLLDRATPAQVDTIAAGFATVGPFFVLNMSNGNPIIVETNTLQMEVEGAHYRPAEAFRTGGRWDTVKMGETVDVPATLAATIRDRLLGILLSQSADILDRGIGTPEDLDLGCRLAFAFRKGPLELMRDLGAGECTRILNRFQQDQPGMPMPKRDMAAYQDFNRFVLVDDVPAAGAYHSGVTADAKHTGVRASALTPDAQVVKVITLRRPEALNAIHDEMTNEILAVLKQFEQDPTVAGFVITGYGARAFSAGADIGRFPSMLGDRNQSAEYARVCSRLLVHLDAFKKPVVAALNGMALGGGLELAMRCHGIVATHNAWMQFPEITLGIVPGIGAMVVPYRRWPAAANTFHHMLTRAEKLSAEAAMELGVIDTLVSDHGSLIPAAVWLVNELRDRTHHIADGPVRIPPVIIEVTSPHAVSGQRLSATVLEILRRSIHDAAAAKSLNEALEIGYFGFGDSACTAAAKEGISAFGERRKPDFAKTG